MNFYHTFVDLCNSKGKAPSRVALDIGISKASVNRWKNGSMPSDATKQKIANYFGVSVASLSELSLDSPGITEDIVTFPVLGEVAAGYDHIAYEDWNGATVDVPKSWLKGRNRDEYFTLQVTGDSMYPMYQDGDIVLVLKQSTMNRSGQIGVVLYDDNCATLKRVEYVDGEDWMTLSPVNPMYAPVTVRDEQLEHCRVLGIPRYVIREVHD